jgi:hypothetical protein
MVSWPKISLWFALSGIWPCISIEISQRDEIICNFLLSTNIASLKAELGWTGWECEGNVAKNLCGGIFWTAIMCSGDNVTQLLFEHRGLIGTLPSEFSLLTDLEWIDFTANSLTGTIPDSYGSLTNLVEITLAENQLNGTIPSSLGQITGLLNLDLSENSFTGTLPPSLGQLSNLMYLMVSHTSLSGPIPDTFGSLSNLELFELTSNSLTGALPPSLTSLHHVQTLRLENNFLSSSLPEDVTGFTALRSLTLENNRLTGTLPLSFLSLSRLQLIRLYGNQNFSSSVNIQELCQGMRAIEVIQVDDDRSNACVIYEEPIELRPGTDPTWSQPDSSIFPLVLVVGAILLFVSLLALDHHCREKKSLVESAEGDEEAGVDPSPRAAGSGAGRAAVITRNPLTARPTSPTSPNTHFHSYSRTLMYGDDDDEEDLHLALRELNTRKAERQVMGQSLSSLASVSQPVREVEMGLQMSLEAVVDRTGPGKPKPGGHGMEEKEEAY